ncbi:MULTISPECIES: Fur family transcriptional regulator [Nesterenkonia]|uniref:Fur family ferric uptake transcriptional regulator n=2 Tax=Nesterenkonia TaxID=57494 RepID=A0A839FN71_9MICC|nr:MULTISPECIES: Fur family transcriptional regulator [Nesterenkonia]MBA8920101.1 Fur family ferric uptake transcriptional regulator [Nesterenkonia jeotgali]NYJ15698.1 Fur family ferric uptake transcriptional regulator [Nesterenkonia sandarakina]
MITSDWPDRLRERGLRVTRQRLAVLEVVAAQPHKPADAIHSAVKEQLPEITVQSVYTVLHDLTARELLRRFDPPGSPACYETRTHDNHHHAICTRCGRIEDVECVHGEAPCLQAPASLGMQIQVADVVFRGICRECAAASEDLVGSGAAEA